MFEKLGWGWNGRGMEGTLNQKQIRILELLKGALVSRVIVQNQFIKLNDYFAKKTKAVFVSNNTIK